MIVFSLLVEIQTGKQCLRTLKLTFNCVPFDSTSLANQDWVRVPLFRPQSPVVTPLATSHYCLQVKILLCAIHSTLYLQSLARNRHLENICWIDNFVSATCTVRAGQLGLWKTLWVFAACQSWGELPHLLCPVSFEQLDPTSAYLRLYSRRQTNSSPISSLYRR